MIRDSFGKKREPQPVFIAKVKESLSTDTISMDYLMKFISDSEKKGYVTSSDLKKGKGIVNKLILDLETREKLDGESRRSFSDKGAIIYEQIIYLHKWLKVNSK